MGVGAINLGRYDLAGGMAFVESVAREEKLPWVSANVRPARGEPPYPAYRVLSWGGRKVAVFGLAPTSASRVGVVVEDPVASARALLPTLPPVDLVICLSDLGQRADRELATALDGIALVVGGGEGARLLSEPEVVGDTVFLRAADRGRQLGVFEVAADALGAAWRSPVWEDAAAAAEARAAKLRTRLDGLVKRDPSTIRSLEKGIARFEAERDEAKAAPFHFRHRLVSLASSVRDDPAVRADINSLRPRPPRNNRPPRADAASPGVPFFDRPVTNRERLALLAEAVKNAPAPSPAIEESPPAAAPPTEGEPRGVGTLTCRRCHPEIYQGWFSSGHARALSDLPSANWMDAACLPCHASAIVNAEDDRREAMVGCEACHGPGSHHTSPGTIRRAPDEATCRACHRPYHEGHAFDFPKAYEAIRCDRWSKP